MSSTVEVPTMAHVEEWDIACERRLRGRVKNDRVDLHPCHGTGRAEWILWMSCCPATVLYCTACKNAVTSFTGNLICTDCGATARSGSAAYRRIEPLNPRRSQT